MSEHDEASRPAASATRVAVEPKLRVRYETTECTFASQFVVNAGTDEIIINFSPGYIQDPAADGPVLPIQSRVAITPAGARRLIDTLNRALANQGRESSANPALVGQAELPKLN